MKKILKQRRIGLYEKALPLVQDIADFADLLRCVKSLGFDYLELSIDESDNRLSRLEWNDAQLTQLKDIMWQNDVSIHSLCLSAHRRFPFGSSDAAIRKHAYDIMEQAIELSYALGIRVIQLAGYDVYYEEHTPESHEFFLQGLRDACCQAEKAGVILAIEIMDTEYMNSIYKYLEIVKLIRSPYLKVYPDMGNLFAWNNDIEKNLKAGIHEIVALHIKDTKAVTEDFPGQFRDLMIGDGQVDFVHYFKILKNLNYNGPFVIEMWANDQQLSDCQNNLKMALERVHSAMDQARYLL